MLKKVLKIWTSFKLQPDKWFFFMFLLTSTLSIRKVLYFFPLNNSFNEYAGVYIYLSDILLIFTFLLYILNNNTYLLSSITLLSIKKVLSKQLFHVEQLQKNKDFKIKNKLKNVPRGTF